MITVIKTPTGFARTAGNPVIQSLDGTKKAPLRVILHPSWADADRAEYGVYVVPPPVVPDGMVAVSAPIFSERDGKVVATVRLADTPPKKTTSSHAEAALHAWAESMGVSLDEIRALLRAAPPDGSQTAEKPS